MKEKTTEIRGATVIAHDGTGHCRLSDGTVVFRGDRIVHVGRGWDGRADEVIDATGKILAPGNISLHAHVSAQELQRSLVDGGDRTFLRSGFLHFLPTRRSGAAGVGSVQDMRASIEFGFAALISQGVTTVLAFAPEGEDHGEAMLAAAEAAGIRLVWAPLVSGGRYWLEENGLVTAEIDESAGMASLERAVQYVEDHRGALDGRLSGAVVLDEYYLSTPALRQAAKRAATELGVPFTMHFLEQHREFFETMSRTGCSPVQLLEDEGVLDPATILAHCLYVSSHSLVRFPVTDDIGTLGRHGVTVAHSPVAFSRRGMMLESFDRYSRAGVRMALGTDTYPLDIYAEMRMASVTCKFTDSNYEAAPARVAYDAATLGGAAALGRDDLGRIAPGAKADLVLLNTATLGYGCNEDPVRAMVHLANGSMVETVFVDGIRRVEAGVPTGFDADELLGRLERSSKRMAAQYAEYHPSGQPFHERFPNQIPEWRE